ncbi:MAG: prepilin-type N-terminal cleavage/methylation domain-containing protein [bacterium]
MKKNGFTLLEVLLSLLILVSAVTIFSSTQLRSVLRISKEREILDRVFIVKSQLIDFIEEQEKKEQKIFKKEIKNPEMKVVSQIIDIDKRSSLKSFANDMKIIKAQGNWNNIGSSYNLPFVTFVKIKENKNG